MDVNSQLSSITIRYNRESIQQSNLIQGRVIGSHDEFRHISD